MGFTAWCVRIAPSLPHHSSRVDLLLNPTNLGPLVPDAQHSQTLPSRCSERKQLFIARHQQGQLVTST